MSEDFTEYMDGLAGRGHVGGLNPSLSKTLNPKLMYVYGKNATLD